MEQIVWTSRLSTGVEKLDHQHRSLIDKLRGLEEAIRSGASTSALLDAFRFLEVYMRDHFRDEEAETARFQCPEVEMNRRGHARFLETMAGLNRRLLDEGPSEPLAQDVHHELAEWFVHHILLLDVRLARMVARVG